MRKLVAFFALLAPGLLACGESIHNLDVFYADEVVAAPTRTVIIRAIGGTGVCSPALSRVFETPGAEEDIIAEFENKFPVNPNDDVLAALPLGRPLALEVAGFDGASNLISRGCVATELTEEGPIDIKVELRALPKCDDVPWSSLDVLIALDTSLQAALSDSDKAHFDGLRDHILKQPNLPLSTQFSLVSFGENSTVREVLAPTQSSTFAITALDSLFNVHSGPSVLFDGIVFATTKLRSRAVCGRYPVMIIVAANSDQSSNTDFSDAAFGVFGAQGDLSDDVYLAGLPLSEPAYVVLNSIVPEESEKGFLAQTGSRALIDFGFQQIRGRLLDFLSGTPEE
jgi:hypothetical protein